MGPLTSHLAQKRKELKDRKFTDKRKLRVVKNTLWRIAGTIQKQKKRDAGYHIRTAVFIQAQSACKDYDIAQFVNITVNIKTSYLVFFK